MISPATSLQFTNQRRQHGRREVARQLQACATDDYLADLVQVWRCSRSGRSGRQQRQLAFEHNGNEGILDGCRLADSVLCRGVDQVAIALAPGKQQIVIKGFYAGTAEISVTPVSARHPVHPNQ